MLLWIALSILALLGVFGVALGVRGRRTDDHPVCRRCRFDLVGVEVDRCPECGRDLSERRAVRTGNRSRRPMFIAGGSLALVLAIAGAGALGWGAATKFNWNTVKPDWLLIMESSGSDTGRIEAALVELLARAVAGDLSGDRIADLARSGLARQADLSTPWIAQWGDIIEHAWSGQLLSDEEFQRYAKQAVLIWNPRDPATTPIDYGWSLVDPRPTTPIRVGEPTNLMAYIGGRGASSSRLFLRPSIESLEINGAPVEPRRRSFSHHGLVGGSGFGGLSAGTWTPDSTGEHTVRFVWRLRVFAADTPRGGAWSGAASKQYDSDDPESPPGFMANLETTHIITYDHEYKISITVEPARVPHEVALVADPALADAVRESISLEFWDASRTEHGVLFRVRQTVDAPPVDIAFRVFLRVGDREWPSITITARAGESESIRMQIAATENGYAEFDARMVDVILRPTPGAVDLEEGYESIWGEEIVIPNVPFVWRQDQP